MQIKTRKAVGAIIGWKDHPGHIILVQKVKTEDIGKADIVPEWDIPKGGMKISESKEETLRRELNEEVGAAKFSVVRELPFGMSYDLPSNGRWRRQDTALFLVEYEGDGKDLRPNTGEIREARMVRINEAKKLVRYDATIAAISKAANFGLV